MKLIIAIIMLLLILIPMGVWLLSFAENSSSSGTGSTKSEASSDADYYGLMITDYTWTSSSSGEISASFSLTNNNDQEVTKMISEVYFFDNSGASLGSLEKIILKRIKAGQTLKITNFIVGVAPGQTTQTGMILKGVTMAGKDAGE